jgi:hypothetical protein
MYYDKPLLCGRRWMIDKRCLARMATETSFQTPTLSVCTWIPHPGPHRAPLRAAPGIDTGAKLKQHSCSY